MITAFLLALAAAQPVADERTALHQRLATAELAYSECLDAAALDAAIAGAEPEQAMEQITPACDDRWNDYRALLRQDHATTIQRAPPPVDHASPEEWAMTFRLAFEGATSNAYASLLERARDWHACLEAGGDADRCLSQARSVYERCLRAAVRRPVAAKDEDDAVFGVMDACGREWSGLAVAARLAPVSQEERRRYRTLMREEVRREHRARVGRPDRHESCAAEAGCSADGGVH